MGEGLGFKGEAGGSRVRGLAATGFGADAAAVTCGGTTGSGWSSCHSSMKARARSRAVLRARVSTRLLGRRFSMIVVCTMSDRSPPGSTKLEATTCDAMRCNAM